MKSDRLALYTTVYPGVEKYLRAWYQSVLAQTDRNFDIFIGVDSLDCCAINDVIGSKLDAKFITAEKGDTPAQVRQKPIENIIAEYPAVVFVDSDDILMPSRVEAARKCLERCDVYGCSLDLIDEEGNSLSITLTMPEDADIGELLLQRNVFGLSNTAYRSEALRSCLPFPPETATLDWFIATRAFMLGMRFYFDQVPRMKYRQHRDNIAPVLPPFTGEQLLVAAERVLKHYELLIKTPDNVGSPYLQRINVARSYAQDFYNAVFSSSEMLDEYVAQLNRKPPRPAWWACVANSRLEQIWKKN